VRAIAGIGSTNSGVGQDDGILGQTTGTVSPSRQTIAQGCEIIWLTCERLSRVGKMAEGGWNGPRQVWAAFCHIAKRFG